MSRIAIALLVCLANLCCAGDAYETLANELKPYLPAQVTAVVGYPGTEHEQVLIRWEKPFIATWVTINGPPGEEPQKENVHDPISIRIVPDTSLKEIYAYKARYFAVKARVTEWRDKLEGMPGVHGKNWGLGGPEAWVHGAAPKSDEQKRLVADYEAFLKNDYEPVMAKERDCPNFIFKGRFIRVESQLDWGRRYFEPTAEDEINKVLRAIQEGCGIVEKY